MESSWLTLTYYFEIILDFGKSLKDCTKGSHIPFTQLALMLISYKIFIPIIKTKKTELSTILLINLHTLFVFHQRFHWCSSSVPGSYVIFIHHHVSLVSSILWHFLSLSLPFMTLTVLLVDFWTAIMECVNPLRELYFAWGWGGFIERWHLNWVWKNKVGLCQCIIYISSVQFNIYL